MHELDDITLLREYAEHDSEEAFAALVTRHINQVYSVALRHTHNPQQAEEITQVVFVILAQKARHLAKGVVLSGWLYQTARLTAVTLIRSEIRRARREQDAYMQTSLNETETDVWPQIAPLLDAAMAGLNETDRHAVVLRFFDGKSMKEVGAALGGSEDAAKMRVNRAVEKLRQFFTRRGVVLSAGVLQAGISAHAVQAAPAVLAKTITAVAMTKGVAASGSTLILTKGALKLMAWTKIKTAVVVGAGILLTGTTTIVISEIEKHRTYSWQVSNPGMRLLNETPPQVRIVPTKSSTFGGLNVDGDRAVGIGVSLADIISFAYENNWTSARTIFPKELSKTRYDFIASLPTGSRKMLQTEIGNQFRFTGKREKRESDVLVLKVNHSGAGGLQPAQGQGLDFGSGHYVAKGRSVSELARDLEGYLGIPVIDRTGLAGQFNFDVTWDEVKGRQNPDGLKEAILNDLGLELVPGHELTEMLVMTKAK